MMEQFALIEQFVRFNWSQLQCSMTAFNLTTFMFSIAFSPFNYFLRSICVAILWKLQVCEDEDETPPILPGLQMGFVLEEKDQGLY